MLIIYGMNRHILIEAVNCAFALARVSNSCRFTFIDCCAVHLFLGVVFIRFP